MDEIDHPPHYGGDTPYEVIKIIEAYNLGFRDGNAVKYLLRAGAKTRNPLVDLEKARWYLNRHIEVITSPEKFPWINSLDRGR